MRRTIATVALMMALLAPNSAAAGPWAGEAGHGYVKLWVKYLFGFGYFAGDGAFHDYGLYQEAFVSAYAEVSIVDRFALILHAPIVQTFHLEDPRDGSWESHVGPGDPTLAVRWQFLQAERFAMGAEAGVRAPFARPGPVQPVYSRAEGNPQIGALEIGNGVWDIPLSISAGYGGDAFYLAGSVGWVLRTSGFDHVLTWSLEGGTTVEGRWGIRGRVVGWHSVPVYFDEGAPRHESPSGIGNGTSYIGFAIEVDYQIEPDWFVGFTGEGGLGYLVRQTGGPVVTLYVARRF
jgi:hypothetical protein